MLQLVIPTSPEGWDEENQIFIEPKYEVLQLEHSLVSISKWESKWCKAFLGPQEKTPEQNVDYIKCMTLTQNVDPEVYDHLTVKNMEEVRDYINSPMTATTINDHSKGPSRDIVTSELIYYWMVALNIPFECQEWHLNRLWTLIRVCNIKNQSPKKMSRREVMSRNAALNAARRKQMNTNG